MDNLFDDPGDLGFFDRQDEVEEEVTELDDQFYEEFPGEDTWE